VGSRAGSNCRRPPLHIRTIGNLPPTTSNCCALPARYTRQWQGGGGQRGFHPNRTSGGCAAGGRIVARFREAAEMLRQSTTMDLTTTAEPFTVVHRVFSPNPSCVPKNGIPALASEP